MKNAKRNMMTAISMLMASTMMISCTKEIPYKEVYKEKVHGKSEIDTNAEYLYVASSDTASNDDLGAARATPYFQGRTKVVKFRFTENMLQAYEVNQEARLKDNTANDKVVFEIPISHVEYRCAEDRYKKCTNREEENNEINWAKKSKFIPKFDSLKTVGINLVPVEMDKVFGTSCYTETSSRFLNYELTNDALNIQVEKTVSGDYQCLRKKNISITDLSSLQSTIVYQYSFAKSKSLVSAAYKPVAYPQDDESTFGFFNTTYNIYDVDYNRSEAGKVALMNRWNPDRKEIVYYLSDNFNKPELASMKKSTQLAFDRVNQGLQDAGIDLQLVLKDPAHKNPGDIRNSMIVLVEDPVASGPLGYGPTVAHPRTGEIVSGRVAMYYGNMLQNIKYTYDEVVREIRYAQKKAATADQTPDPAVGGSATDVFSSAKMKHDTQMAKYLNNTISKKLSQKSAVKYQANTHKNVKSNDFMAIQSAEKIAKMTRTEFTKATLQKNTKMSDDVLSVMSKHCTYPAELFPFDEAVKNGLQGKLGEDLKLWADLSDKEKEEVIALIGPEIWLPTLIHELGHNLGLRHNFNGSEDKANFYSKAELAKMGVKHEIPYSSVMDYGYSELNLLPTLGKYDIAALRFGYNREVTTSTGETVKVATTLKDLKKTEKADLKQFGYCSDEHVDVNPGCKRFDKGTTLTEIVSFLIKQNEDFYSRRYFRNGRESFSQMSDAAVSEGIRKRFIYLRAFMERYDDIKNRFHLADDAKEWNDVAWLKDLKEAALISGRYFMTVLTTPDLTCVIAKDGKIVGAQPLNSLGVSRAANCFEAEINPAYKVVGEYGKTFNHLKSTKSENNYADQIDVRGYYLEKMVAADMLFQRSIGNSSFDQSQGNYLDMADLTEEITNTVNTILLDQVVAKVDVKDAEGNVIGNQEVPAAMFSTPTSMKKEGATHWIPAALDKSIADKLELPMQPVSFQQVLLEKMNKSMSSSQTHWIEDKSFMDNFRVFKTNSAYQVNSNADTLERNLGGTKLVATPENSLAGELIGLSNVADALSKLTEEQMQQLINERNAAAKAQQEGKAVSTMSALPPVYGQIPSQYIQLFIQGRLDTDKFNYLLMIMPDAQSHIGKQGAVATESED